ncbi:MAG: hypothetical protein M3Q08_01040 [Pseudomonadota bacterium]|nr:hypothetical protein [Pseudomonadota bacterium]
MTAEAGAQPGHPEPVEGRSAPASEARLGQADAALLHTPGTIAEAIGAALEESFDVPAGFDVLRCVGEIVITTETGQHFRLTIEDETEDHQ